MIKNLKSNKKSWHLCNLLPDTLVEVWQNKNKNSLALFFFSVGRDPKQTVLVGDSVKEGNLHEGKRF